MEKSTEHAYSNGARQLRQAALAALPDSAGLNGEGGPTAELLGVEAFWKKRDVGLAEGSICLYRRQFAWLIDENLALGADREVAERVRASLRAELERLRPLPRPKYGASNKTEVPKFDHVRATFLLLRDRGVETGDVTDIILGLYLLCIPRLGLRPVELNGAERVANGLRVRTAKKRGRKSHRTVPLTGWSLGHVLALDLLLLLWPHDLEGEAFIAHRNHLATRLARASREACGERLALYFARHTAVAIWRRTGLSEEQIRVLAGHAGYAARFYGRKGGAHADRWVEFIKIVAPVLEAEAEPEVEPGKREEKIDAVRSNQASAGKSADSKRPDAAEDGSGARNRPKCRAPDSVDPAAPDAPPATKAQPAARPFVVEEFPQPKPVTERHDHALSPEQVARWNARLAESIDPASIDLEALARSRRKHHDNNEREPDPPGPRPGSRR